MPIRFAIAEEIADNQDSQDQEDNHEYLEIELHFFAHGPADEDHKRAVEESGLE